MAAKKTLIVFIIAIIFLIIIRLCMPYALLYYVTKQINKIPEYKAQIDDIDIHLYRGSYTIKHLQLWKINHKIPVPFLNADSINLSVQWKAFFHGKFVAQMRAVHPVLNFVVDPTGSNDQLSINKIWIDIVKSLFPLNFNDISVQEGIIYFRSFSSHPPFNVILKNIHLQISNIQNANNSSLLLPSTFEATAFTSDKGQLKLQGEFNAFKKAPAFYLSGRLENIQVSLLKNLLKSYTGVNVESGNFSLYTEITAANGNVKGYTKPFIKNLKVTPPQNASLVETVKNGLASIAAKVLENPHQKTVATQINFAGKIKNPDKSILSIIFYSLRHAFIQSLLPEIDHSIQIQKVFPQDDIQYNTKI